MPAVRAIPSLLRILALLAAAALPTATARTLPPDALAEAVAQLEGQLRQDPRRVDAPALDAYLHKVLCRLDADRCSGLRLLILREPGFNAAIAPGGLVVLRTGALLRCHDEAELALVLAHELAHDRRGDAGERWRRARAGRGDDPGGTHSREAEAAADAEAIGMLALAGYDIAAGERLWTRLLAEEAGGPGRRRTSDPTHPRAAARLEAFRNARIRLGGGEGTPARGDTGGTDWLRQLAPHRPAWLDDEVARGNPAATVAMLEAAIAATAAPRAVDVFALGQALRRRAAPGDRRRAGSRYSQAIALPDAPASAWREHGLARLTDGAVADGRTALSRYLASDPDAADAPFVAAMLEGAAPPAPDRANRRGAGPGELRVFDLRLSTALPWQRQRGIGMEQWTLDGVDRNRLLVVPNLRPGEPLFRDAGRTGPRHRPGLRPDEQRDAIVSALDAAGWLDVRADGPRRHDFGGVPGWHSELSLASAAGARYRGSVAFVERDGRLTLLLWFATAGSHFPRDTEAVEAMLASARFAD